MEFRNKKKQQQQKLANFTIEKALYSIAYIDKMGNRNWKQFIKSKFKNRKHPQIIYNFYQSDLNLDELRWKTKKDENVKCAYLSHHSDITELYHK